MFTKDNGVPSALSQQFSLVSNVNVFDFADVVNGTAQKLVLRHPHIFAGYDNKTVDGVLQKWEEIKQQEKGQKTVTETLDAVPKSFPALMYAQKIQKRAKAGGLIQQE